MIDVIVAYGFGNENRYNMDVIPPAIQLSNRTKGIGDHMPFNDARGKLNLVAFVNDLKKRYNWSGIIVMEHMEYYKDKTMKSYEYLKKLLA